MQIRKTQFVACELLNGHASVVEGSSCAPTRVPYPRDT